MPQSFSAKIEKDELVIRVKLSGKPQVSSTGKTLVVASSHGNHRTAAEVEGIPVTVGFNAYIPNPDYVKAA